MRNPACARFGCAALLLVVTGACALSTPPMPVPEALAASQEWPVQMRHDWNSPPRFRFGPYRVQDVRYHDIRQRGGVVDALKGKREYQQRYEFTVRDSAQDLLRTQVSCDSRDRDRGFSVGAVDVELESGLSLECQVSAPIDTAATWTVRLAGRDSDAVRGVFEGGGRSFEIVGEQTHPESDDGFPAGYLLRRDGVVVGMVDRTNTGAIRLSPGLPRDEQELLAAALMALLLQRKLIES